MRTRPVRGGLTTAVAVLVCVLALAACGSSKPKHSGHQNPEHASHHNPVLAFSECMRAHGVTNFPDPSASGGLSLGAGVNSSSPTFRTAQDSCFKLLPGGGPNHQKPTASEIKLATRRSECMRAHGVTGFPDPFLSTVMPTIVDPSRFSFIMDRGGIVVEAPKSINRQSPAFEAAAKTCKFGGTPNTGV